MGVACDVQSHNGNLCVHVVEMDASTLVSYQQLLKNRVKKEGREREGERGREREGRGKGQKTT